MLRYDFFSWGDGELWAERGWFMLLLHHFIQWTSTLASTDWPQAVPQHNCQERWIPDKRWLKRLILKTAKNSEHNKLNSEYGTDIILPDSADKGHISLLVSCAPATSHMSHSCHFNLWGECTPCCRKWLHAPQFPYYSVGQMINHLVPTFLKSQYSFLIGNLIKQHLHLKIYFKCIF